MPLRLDLAAMSPAELSRIFESNELEAILPALTQAQQAGQAMLAPDDYPNEVVLQPTSEEDWDTLGASLDSALAARAVRDDLHGMGFEQVGAFSVANLPYKKLFFAYVKSADTFAALTLSDAAGPAPTLEVFTLFRQAKDGFLGVVSSNAAFLETLDPSPCLLWQSSPQAEAAVLFQLHRGKVLEFGKANKAASTVEQFMNAYLVVHGENLRAWQERGVLKSRT